MRQIEMIGQAHLDIAWLWRWQEGYIEVLSTFRSDLDRLKESDDFIFTCSSAVYYRFVEEQDPRMFEEIRQRVLEGRWVIVGGWWLQPDTNLPNGETFARHALYSQRYYREKFGVICKTGYCVDSFGQSMMLPQLLKQGGMENYIFMRPDVHENPNIPPLFWWSSPDGSKVLTYRISGQPYCNHELTETWDSVRACGEENDIPVMCFYGVGNHGGGPTRRHLEEIHERQEKDPEVEFSSPDRYFDGVRAEGLQLPELEGELQMHAIGCYAVNSRIKTQLRSSEQMVIRAEKAAAIAGALFGGDDRAVVAGAWDNIMFNTFHDIVCGCTVRTATEDALDMFGESRSAAAKLQNRSLAMIARNIDTMIDGATNKGKKDWQFWEEDDHGVPMMMFNPLSWEVRTPVVLAKRVSTVCDAAGRPMPLQYVRGEEINVQQREATVFVATVPAMGYTTCWVYRDRVIEAAQPEIPDVSPYILENDFVRVTFDKDSGYVTGYFDKRTRTELLAGDSFVPEVFNDAKFDTWAHAQDRFSERIARMRAVKAERVENGRIRQAMRVKYVYNQSYLLVEYRLYAASDAVETVVKAVWTQEHTILKFAFSTAVSEGKTAAQVPYGVVKRNCDAREYPMQAWVSLTDEDGSGLAVLNDSKYSYHAENGTLYVTVLRNSIYADHWGVRVDGEQYDFTDEGLHNFRLKLCPLHAQKDFAYVQRMAEEFNNPPEIVIDSYHPGTLPRERSFLSASDNVAVTAFKQSEDGNGYILRCQDIGGSGGNAEIHAGVLEASIQTEFQPQEVKTFLFTGGRITEVNFCEWPE